MSAPTTTFPTPHLNALHPVFIQELAYDTFDMLAPADHAPPEQETARHTAAMVFIESLAPRTPLQAVLGCQILASHHQAASCFKGALDCLTGSMEAHRQRANAIAMQRAMVAMIKLLEQVQAPAEPRSRAPFARTAAPQAGATGRSPTQTVGRQHPMHPEPMPPAGHPPAPPALRDPLPPAQAPAQQAGAPLPPPEAPAASDAEYGGHEPMHRGPGGSAIGEPAAPDAATDTGLTDAKPPAEAAPSDRGAPTPMPGETTPDGLAPAGSEAAPRPPASQDHLNDPMLGEQPPAPVTGPAPGLPSTAAHAVTGEPQHPMPSGDAPGDAPNTLLARRPVPPPRLPAAPGPALRGLSAPAAPARPRDDRGWEELTPAERRARYGYVVPDSYLRTASEEVLRELGMQRPADRPDPA